MKTYVKVALAVVVIIAVSSILAGLYFYNLKSADLAKTRPDFVITASALQKAFENNETESSSRYIKKILEVTGKISSVKSAENNAVNISLATDNDLSSIICTFPVLKDESAFKPGDIITLRGECSGYLMDVLLNNCAVIRPKKQ